MELKDQSHHTDSASEALSSATTQVVDVYQPLPLTPEQVNPPEPAETRLLKWAFLGDSGIRAGWSVAIFLAIFIFTTAIAFVAYFVISGHGHFGPSKQASTMPESLTAGRQIVMEGIQVFGLLCATGVMALIERRRITAYYLGGRKPVTHFVSGLVFGFVALSALVGVLYLGHWITFGPLALSGAAILQYATLWAIGFMLVALSEEGLFRCYFLFTLTRGFFARPAGFWLAALVSSILFGLAHTGNTGESQFGVICTGTIGFVFCMSIRYTGSAWWAIGYHAAWDWAQTFFYGTADSGLVAKGHWLTSNPAGNPLWSGGSVGPEGSLLILPVILLTALGLYLGYGRKSHPETQPALNNVSN
jgi:membrane protease YdiL (CAAX protease family)